VDNLNSPHGGTLVNGLVDDERKQELKEESRDWLSWDLTPRQICDLELILNGGFSPLTGFMGQEDFESVCTDMRLKDGTLWPLPITLDLTEEIAEQLEPGSPLVLRDSEGMALAVLWAEDTWELDRDRKADAVYGTHDRTHPGVAHLYERTNNIAVGGRLEGLELPAHYDFVGLRLTPRQVRRRISKMGWRKVVAFQTRNPMHRAHYELTLRAARDNEASLLIHPVVGMTKPGDVDHYTRVRCYQAVLDRYPRNTAMLSLLPLAMRMGGPREALLHAIIRKNYGCTHFIVGRDHAGPGNDATGKPFYGPYDAQELMREHQDELGIEMVPFKMVVYVEDKDTYMPIDEAPEGSRTLSLSGTELRERLADGRDLPEWFTFREVGLQLRRTHPPRHQQGFTVFFTGLSGSGKSTVANVLMVKLLEMGGRPVSLLDGDIVRRNLSSELGFSKEHRDLNIQRIGYVASEITKNGGIAICAPIAPYASVRKQVRETIKPGGGFILVHISTPLEVCEQRDRKGLYAKARAGIIKQFTGISDPYEVPESPDLTIDTSNMTPEESAQAVILHLESEGYIGSSQGASVERRAKV
jgi:sulfate adenylyltransferase